MDLWCGRIIHLGKSNGRLHVRRTTPHTLSWYFVFKWLLGNISHTRSSETLRHTHEPTTHIQYIKMLCFSTFAPGFLFKELKWHRDDGILPFPIAVGNEGAAVLHSLSSQFHTVWTLTLLYLWWKHDPQKQAILLPTMCSRSTWGEVLSWMLMDLN